MSPAELSALEAAIVDACTKHEQTHRREYGSYHRCIPIGTTEYFVKYNDSNSLWPEIATQKYIFEYAESHPDTPGMPRIPKVTHYFEVKHMMYMVMEYITLRDPGPDLPGRTTEALIWLSGVPAPPGHVIGPLGGGPILHRFFKDYEAPVAFTSTGALERYIQRASKLRCKAAKPPLEPVSFAGERLMFVQSDMDPSNFGVDEEGNTVLMDFAQVAVLPESFAALASPDLASSLDLSQSNLWSMAVISSLLWMAAGGTFGLNEDGYPKASVRKR